MDSEKIDPKVIGTILIFISIGLILGASYFIVSEILRARKECNSFGGEYNFKIFKGHLCNGRKFVEYNSCFLSRGCNLIWVFDKYEWVY